MNEKFFWKNFSQNSSMEKNVTFFSRLEPGIPFVQVLQVCEVFQKPAEIPAIPAKIHAKHANDPLHE